MIRFKLFVIHVFLLQKTNKVATDTSSSPRERSCLLRSCTAGSTTQTWSASGAQKRTSWSRRWPPVMRSGSASSKTHGGGRTSGTPPSDPGRTIVIVLSLMRHGALQWLSQRQENGPRWAVEIWDLSFVPVSRHFGFGFIGEQCYVL